MSGESSSSSTEPTDDEVIGEALQALVDEHSKDTDETPSLDLSPTAGFDPIVDEAEHVRQRVHEPLFDDERHYPDGLDGLRRVEDENNSTTDDNQR